MINLFKKISVVFILLLCFEVNAQFQGNGGMNGGMNGGVDRRIGRQNTNGANTKREPIDFAKIMLDDISKNLALDGFQNAIVKNLITEYLKTANDIALENIPEDAKLEKTLIARTLMEEKFAAIFSEKQKILFQEMKDQNSGKKKTKKKKKDNDEKE